MSHLFFIAKHPPESPRSTNGDLLRQLVFSINRTAVRHRDWHFRTFRMLPLKGSLGTCRITHMPSEGDEWCKTTAVHLRGVGGAFHRGGWWFCFHLQRYYIAFRCGGRRFCFHCKRIVFFIPMVPMIAEWACHLPFIFE